ncbi:hypothetical protein Cgig2_027853 [Carnegiea gigantea]|uniref:Katanin p80 WD40 repeat-containing subunit B1 homolog n=1 Tax=Carnegiea gigantea TaxID=171969 RepID=A0A9Q1JTI5_9CARY|nr:hypothetical protein Cgig2_027853 [Carnegiea gigantea]
MTTKRAYKLQEFVAHSSTVNCLKIGRKSSRVLVTGGEDHKVNLWAIGKPNAILSLSGHSSGIDSVGFDSSEVLVAAGAASGTIKLWDLEEAKIVRTLTGHRSNCISVDFHPFGEFFASGSLDTNLKIWDIRKKGCIHTYKGHTRGVNSIRFTPDGRWVVSGGEDNTVKLWDLTAGKLLHDFKSHEGQIQCIDFHPHEFLLATGSSDKTVKFWDLETFELIGSAGPETSGVRCMTFNPDGRTLLCGLHESLKVFSWEPIRSHDTIDVGWSKLSDLNIHEGKLLGCSYNQSCVGVWVVDISRLEPYSVRMRSNGHSEAKSSPSGNFSVATENTAKIGRLSVSQNSDSVEKETKSLGRLPLSANSSSMIKEPRVSAAPGAMLGTPQRVHLSTSPKNTVAVTAVSSTVVQKRNSSRTQSTPVASTYSKSDIVPVFVPRNDVRSEQADESKRDLFSRRSVSYPSQPKPPDSRRFSDTSEESDEPTTSDQPEPAGDRAFDSVVTNEIRVPKTSRDGGPVEVQCSVDVNICFLLVDPQKSRQEGHSSSTEKDETSVTDDDIIADIIGRHDEFFNSMQSRLDKLQVLRRFWDRSDVKGAIGAMEKMADHGVVADVVSFLTEKTDIVTLEICTGLLPVLAGLLESDVDRHLGISLEMLIKLVRVFGSVIYSTLSASSSVGVDVEAEQRLERCNLCYIELERVKRCLPALMRLELALAAAVAHASCFLLTKTCLLFAFIEEGAQLRSLHKS